MPDNTDLWHDGKVTVRQGWGGRAGELCMGIRIAEKWRIKKLSTAKGRLPTWPDSHVIKPALVAWFWQNGTQEVVGLFVDVAGFVQDECDDAI